VRSASVDTFWTCAQADLFGALGTSPSGLTEGETATRLREIGPNLLVKHRRTDLPALIVSQLASPIVLILLAATGLAFFLGDAADAAIVLAIVAASAALGVWQEHGASQAVKALLAQVATLVQVVRGGKVCEVPIAEVVPGDVALLSAGRSVPGDYLTFGALLLLYGAHPVTFRTGWFIESVISAASVVLVVRSRRPFGRSRPGHSLVRATPSASP
jgi:P-type Mg2+ transporter